MPTLKDVAALAGVSAATVSLYLNGKICRKDLPAETKRNRRSFKAVKLPALICLQATKRAGHFPPYIHSCCILGS